VNSLQASKQDRQVGTVEEKNQLGAADSENEHHTSSKQIGHLWSLSGVFQSLYFPVSNVASTFSGVARGFASPSV
jgi:hypothetical protein